MRVIHLVLSLILTTIFVIGCSGGSNKSFHLNNILQIESYSEIKEIKVKNLDTAKEVDILDKQQVNELCNYLNTINFKELSSSNRETYKQPINEYELNIYGNKGNDVIQIKNQGTFFYIGAKSYRITNENLDLGFLKMLFK